jgi:hypothetical protein
MALADRAITLGDLLGESGTELPVVRIVRDACVQCLARWGIPIDYVRKTVGECRERGHGSEKEQHSDELPRGLVQVKSPHNVCSAASPATAAVSVRITRLPMRMGVKPHNRAVSLSATV